jgi:hypothetical protein
MGVILHRRRARPVILKPRAVDNTRMLLAQAAAEYVGFSAVMEALSRLWYTAEYQLSRLGSSGYALVALALIALFFFRSRR